MSSPAISALFSPHDVRGGAIASSAFPMAAAKGDRARLGAAIGLETPKLESFGRCVVLRAAQRALDGRPKVPALAAFILSRFGVSLL